jgi:hypothetical protein
VKEVEDSETGGNCFALSAYTIGLVAGRLTAWLRCPHRRPRTRNYSSRCFACVVLQDRGHNERGRTRLGGNVQYHSFVEEQIPHGVTLSRSTTLWYASTRTFWTGYTSLLPEEAILLCSRIAGDMLRFRGKEVWQKYATWYKECIGAIKIVHINTP